MACPLISLQSRKPSPRASSDGCSEQDRRLGLAVGICKDAQERGRNKSLASG
jgi:hypothetical protein